MGDPDDMEPGTVEPDVQESEAADRPEDETRRRFQALLDAKKKDRHAANTPQAQREQRGGRPEGAKGSRGFTRRKV